MCRVMGTSRFCLRKRGSRMIVVLLPVFLLVILIHPLHGTELCPFLDKVIASIRDKPPFATVRYLDAPGGKCGVSDAKGHFSRGNLWAVKQENKMLKESWACAWDFSGTASKDPKVSELRARHKAIRSERRMAHRREMEAFHRWTDSIIRGENPPEQLEAEYRNAESEHKRISDLSTDIRRELKRELGRVGKVDRNKLYAQARKFVSAISSCISEKN